MSTNALKFETSGGDIYFPKSCIPEIVESPNQKIVIHKNPTGAYYVQVYNDQFMEFDVLINENSVEIMNDIDSLLAAGEELVFYPCFDAQPTLKYNVIIVPDMIVRTLFFGRPEALRKTSFKMLESSK
jgi:hypothetical protein